MRRFALPAVVLVLLFALGACERGGGRSPGPGESAPPSGGGDSPSVAPVGAGCTLVIGFSVTEDWFRVGAFETEPGIDDSAWEVLALGGHDVMLWSDPALAAFSRAPSSPCRADPDRIVFQVAAQRWRSESTGAIVDALRASIDNFHAKWPTARVIELIPIVGGPDGRPCPFGASKAGVVDASEMNPVMNDVIAVVANGSDVVAGPDPLLADCLQYADVRGHLTEDGSRYIASVLAEHYA